MGASSAETTRRRLDGAGGDDAFATMAVATPVDEIATTTDSEAFFTTTACYAHPSPQAPFVPRALDAAPPPFEPTIAMVAEMDLGEALGATRVAESDLGAALGAPRPSAAPGGRLPPLPLDLSGRSLDLGAPPLSSGRRRPRRAAPRGPAPRPGDDDPPPAYDAAYDPPPAFDDAPRQPSGGLARCGSLDGLWREVASPRHRGGDAEAYLQRLNLPLGLKLQLQKSVDTYVERIWIIDNSGSMSTCDGHKIMRSACGDVSVTCSPVWKSTAGSDVPTKLRNSLARSNRSRFGRFLDESIALGEFSKRGAH